MADACSWWLLMLMLTVAPAINAFVRVRSMKVK